MKGSVRTVDRAVHISIIILGFAVGLWFAAEFVGFYPSPIEHCPDSEFSCPSQNIRNLIPAAAGAAVAGAVVLPLTYLYNEVIR